MCEQIIEQQSAISAVLLESKSFAVREMMLTGTELSKMDMLIAVLEPFAQATELPRDC